MKGRLRLPPSTEALVQNLLDEMAVNDLADRRSLDGGLRRWLWDRRYEVLCHAVEQQLFEMGVWPPLPSSDTAATPNANSDQLNVLRWAAERDSFSRREIMRSQRFDSANHAQAVLLGLVAAGKLELVPPPPRRGARGRRPGPRFRLVRHPDVTETATRAQGPTLTWPEPAEPELEWPTFEDTT